MKRIRIFIAVMISAVLCTMGASCSKDQQNSVAAENYTVTVLNHSEWSLEGDGEFYNMKGERVATVPISSGKATAKLDEGTYIFQLAKAPESVNYDIVVLDSSSKIKTVELTDSEIYEEIAKFKVLVAVRKGDAPLPGATVILCYEPENLAQGYCLMPRPTDANGLFADTVNAGMFHLSIKSADQTETLYDNKDNKSEITASHRFIIAEVSE